MKFRITSTNWWKPDEIIKWHPYLKNFGYEVVTIRESKSTRIRDEKGEFISQIDYRETKVPYIQIDSVERLLELHEQSTHELVIGIEKEPFIEIYDGYRE